MKVIARNAFHWDDNDLIFQKRVVCSLVPCEEYGKHYHLKFEWRDDKTPEFFNIINARENARMICRKHYEETACEGSLMRLNEQDVDMCHFDFKSFVEAYRCRICKIDLNLDNFGGLGPNHGIFCKDCYGSK